MSRWLALRAPLSVAGAIALLSSCDGDAEGGPSGQGGAGASSGNGGASGAAGSRGGQAGVGGTYSCRYRDDVDTRVSGQGFSYPDGTAVTAVFGANASQSAAKQLQGGVFELSFFQSGSCSLGTSRYVPAALYIDADGDGACRLAADEVFVWLASGGPAGNISLALFSPDGAHCPAWVPASLAADVVATVRQLCPEIGECLPFCGLPNPSVPGSGENTAGCASGDAGVEDGGAPDSGGGSSGDAAVRDAAL